MTELAVPLRWTLGGIYGVLIAATAVGTLVESKEGPAESTRGEAPDQGWPPASGVTAGV